MAKLYFRYGAMNSGKSTALLQVAYNYEERGMHVILLKPHTDTKGEDTIVSRLGMSRKVDLIIQREDDVRALIKAYSSKRQLDCILVDEVQFFSTEHIDAFFEVAVTMGIPVICYGLRTDFKTNGFEGSSRLLLLAHTLEELKTICRCGKKAVLNGRTMDGEFVFEGSQVAIDGAAKVSYESLCASCYFRLKAAHEAGVEPGEDVCEIG